MEEIVHKRYKLKDSENYDYFIGAINKNNCPELSFLIDNYNNNSKQAKENYYWYFIHSDGAVITYSESHKENLILKKYIELIGNEILVDKTRLSLEQRIGELEELKLP